jgi:phosphoribosylglycinamide formyltransferase 1
VAVLASGTGTILEALLEAGVPVTVVVADRPCRALEVARTAGKPAELIRRNSFGPDFDRLSYTRQVVDALAPHEVDLVVLAGFLTVLERPILDAWPGRVLNTHPSLLPAFPGAHAVADALAAGVKVTGCTLHVAAPEVDTGPILVQEAVAVLPDDTPESLHERIKVVERRLYPGVIRAVLAGDRLPGAKPHPVRA